MSKKNRAISINRWSRRGRFQRRHNRLTVILRVLAGSLTGAQVLAGVKVHVLRVVFPIVISALPIEIIYSSFTGRI